jgi:hypothetical protein
MVRDLPGKLVVLAETGAVEGLPMVQALSLPESGGIVLTVPTGLGVAIAEAVREEGLNSVEALLKKMKEKLGSTCVWARAPNASDFSLNSGGRARISERW